MDKEKEGNADSNSPDYIVIDVSSESDDDVVDVPSESDVEVVDVSSESDVDVVDVSSESEVDVDMEIEKWLKADSTLPPYWPMRRSVGRYVDLLEGNQLEPEEEGNSGTNSPDYIVTDVSSESEVDVDMEIEKRLKADSTLPPYWPMRRSVGRYVDLLEGNQLEPEDERDYEKLGRDQELYFFHESSPGSCFFMPKGTHIYNNLMEMIREEYRKRGFDEVISPSIYNVKLWQTSGHYQKHADKMFAIDIEKEQFVLKPIHCPGHCLMFSHRPRSWRELPLRMADFGVLHRNEVSEALSGLTRARRVQHDDAHIFCTPDQLGQEIDGALDFLKHVYGILGFTFELQLSTRPEKYLGDIEMWNEAEKQFTDSLNKFAMPWIENPGNGAFYGPKIDVTIKDVLKRAFKCGKIELDFELPIRFDLNYIDENGEKKRPVIIHRAVLDSFERMIAILIEAYAGKWPFWLSPRQACVVPVDPAENEYAEKVRKALFEAGFQVEVDTYPGNLDTFNNKIRNTQLNQFNYILVLGEREKEAGTVNVRTRDNKVFSERSLKQLLKHLKQLQETRSLQSEDSFE